MEKYRISVIVPIYNVESYLEHCVESIRGQTYQDLEILLVDDGSTDDSGRICDRYAALDPRITVIHQENKGVVSARKAGLQHAQGEYIGFVDGDDYLEPEMYASLLQIVTKENVDFVHSGYYVDEKAGVYGTGADRVFEACPKNAMRYLQECVLDPVSRWRILPSNWSKLYRNKLIKEAYFDVPDEISYGEDLLCLCNCILKCQRFCISSKAYYHYVTRENSVCNKKNAEIIHREYKLYDALGNLFRRSGVYNELQNALERFYLYCVTACIKRLGNKACPLYQYPVIEELAGEKILLYGAGEVGQDYYTQMRRDMRCKVLGVTDSCYQNYPHMYMNLRSPEEVLEYPYDKIVISVLSEGTATAIKTSLLEKGVQAERILWRKPNLIV